MFDRFTDKARKVWALANQEAQRFNGDCIDTADLLLALAKEGTSFSATSLKSHGADLNNLRIEVEKLVRSRVGACIEGKLPLSPAVRAIADRAIAAADDRAQNYIGTEHLLLGLLEEADPVATQALTNLHIDLSKLQSDVVAMLAGRNTSVNFGDLLGRDLFRRNESHLRRERRAVTSIDATHVERDGKRYVNFASNDYLGLTHHPRVIEAARDSIARCGVGSGAAKLITGYSPSHAHAEATIAKLKGSEASVLLPSGYQANHAAVQPIAATAPSARFLLDKLAHASLIDAIRGSGAEFRVIPHNDMEMLRKRLAESAKDQLQVVVTESIFSMDGDAADLHAIAELKREFPFVFLLDEAHGTGVYGSDGAGYANELGLSGIVDVSIVTLSKAIGCIGGAVCGSKVFCESLVNHGRAYIYSTSVPAFVADSAAAAIEVMRDEPQRQTRVRELATRVRRELSSHF